MRVALLFTFAAGKKEPLCDALDRVYQGFQAAGIAEPVIRFNFGDRPIASSISSVDRVLKRHPELARFVTNAQPAPGIPGARRISNGPLSAGAGESIPFAALREIAAGVPRSFPFHSVALHFYAPPFGELMAVPGPASELMAGVLLTDSWWVNGRTRSLTACCVVDADPASKKLPPPPEPVAAVLAACGKIRKTVQAPLPAETPTAPTPAVRLPSGHAIPSASPQLALAVRAIADRYRARMLEIAEAAMPHDLAPDNNSGSNFPYDVTPGPKKPVLEEVFGPLGYTVRGESGAFTLRRRSASNLTVEIHMDVGTWGHRVLAMFRVLGVGFKAVVTVPVAPRAVMHAQFPIGDADQWRKIVENLGALIAELDRAMVPEIEAAAGPQPAWYRPES